MFEPYRRACTGLALLVAAWALGGCETGSELTDRTHTRPDPSLVEDAALFEPPDSLAADAGTLRCDPVLSSEALPPRSDVLTRPSLLAPVAMTTDDLFQRFASYCGGCHVEQAQGQFRVSRRSFATDAAALQLRDSLRRIRSDDPAQVMPKPPEGKPFKDRPATDPLRQFALFLEAWLQAGRPDDVFYPSQADAAGSGRYFVSKTAAEQMTNLGSCIPSVEGFATEAPRSQELDAKFASMQALPTRLEETDLFTLDTAELARHGVVAFAPAYTLWADNAKKQRLVRVPRGESVRFDAATQSFTIPANTRFYKTFLKQVTDRFGNKSYRKLETRLIVARPDDDAKTGADAPTALFGTYAWNEEETEATLVRDPLKNGKPFRDRLVTYYLDEQEVERRVAAGSDDLEDLLKDAALSRRYAIPGSERCIQCHMGSPSQSFVLGFTPLQLLRRPQGQGGVIEPAERDELNQLERLIAYGVVTGLASADEVLTLEDSQGARKPRNDHELEAQGYMLGNCAHCHNPRGYPTSISPELSKVLNFLPGVESGGIFEFPLDRFSPRIFRGPNQDVPIPYITPSLFDLPGAYAQLSKLRTMAKPRPPGFEDRGPPHLWWAPNDTVYLPLEAPWRSLIYRNVDTPFSYEDDSTVFPHMPRNTPGYDCRARKLLGDWMVSIPARWRSEQPPSDVIYSWIPDLTTSLFAWRVTTTLAVGEPQPNQSFTSEAAFADPQPYVEVRPGEPSYASAAVAAEVRLKQWRATGRYTQCPDEALDIVDSFIVHGNRTVPVPESDLPDQGGSDPGAGGLVPERSHWFVMDLTQPEVDWQPRRTDWAGVLNAGEIPVPGTVPMIDTEEYRARNDRKTVYLLTGKDVWRGKLTAAAQAKGLYEYPERGESVRLTESFRRFALTPLPYGLWSDKPECQCKLQDQASVSDARFAGEARPRWFDRAQFDGVKYAPAPAGAKVFSTAPGAQVFASVCANCHGPKADSRGRMADTIADLTGGDTQVANLRDGFFGPPAAPGRARAGVFELGAAGGGASAEDWAARYLLWMGLGGTQRRIPQPVLNVVATTRVLGLKREGLERLADVGANMLAVPEFLCTQLLAPAPFDAAAGAMAAQAYYPRAKDRSLPAPPLSLFGTNGDAELWERVCTGGEVFPYVLTVRLVRDKDGNPQGLSAAATHRRSAYPADAPVGRRAQIRPTLEQDNVQPWCLDLRVAADRAEILRLFRAARGAGAPEPICPDVLFDPGQEPSADEKAFWARRGAMNAGLSVFVYLDALARGQIEAPVEYDQCEKLPEPSAACRVQP